MASIRSKFARVAVGTVLVAALAAPAASQAPLVDYETSAKAAEVRAGAAWRLAFRPALGVLQQTVAQLRNAPGVPAATQAQVDTLVQQAGGQPEPEARRTLWRAVVLLNGQAWGPEQDLLGALALRTPTPIWTGAADKLSLDALYPPAKAAGATYSVDLYATEPTTSATPKKGALIRRVAAGRLTDRFPQPVAANLKGVADGAYLLIASVGTGAAAKAEIVQPVYLVHDLDARHAALKARLAHIAGHEEAKALAEYPFALAEAVRAGKREIISYDFPTAIARSDRIVAALKAGHDEVRQARGLQNRAYRFAPTGELVPFQVYVPSNWTPDRKWPLVVALHGANLDETNMLGRDGGRMQKVAEQHGFVVVAPLGYRLNSAYGSERGMSRAIVGDQVERRQRSEQDVLQVIRIIQGEYNIDPRRQYLTGNSMGGGGTWWIGGRYPDMWAAIAPGAYGGVLPEDAPNLGRMPILAVVGDKDELGMLDRVKASVATLRAAGVNPEYLEVPGGTHSSAYERSVPAIFDFFEKHAK